MELVRASEQQASPLRRDAQSPAGSTWPLWDQAYHFELGHIINSAIVDAISPPRVGELGSHHAGLWECNLADETLTWSGGVYDLFGLERQSSISREQALAHYTEESRARLERIRTDAIRQRCGFTLDVEIRAAAVGKVRKIRLIGAPAYVGELAVRIHGLKLVI